MTQHEMMNIWSITGCFICRHHVEPRVKLYSPREDSFPLPLKYIDVTRTTNTSLDALLENILMITGTLMKIENFRLTWEANPRHANLEVAELGLRSARPQTSPSGPKPSTPLDHEELDPGEQKPQHRVLARLAHLAADRLDIAFACKECSRTISKATLADHTRLKRIGRYLFHTPRAVWEYALQSEENFMTNDGQSDDDAASCTKTRRSTSGGCLRVGQHTLATWSSTQKQVSLSCEESEYYSRVSCASDDTRLGTRSSRENLDRRCSSTRASSLQRERRHQTHWDDVPLLTTQTRRDDAPSPGPPDKRFSVDQHKSKPQKAKNQVLRIEKQTLRSLHAYVARPHK